MTLLDEARRNNEHANYSMIGTRQTHDMAARKTRKMADGESGRWSTADRRSH